MVSIRCKMLVKSELEKLGLQFGVVDLGVVDIKGSLTDEQHATLKSALLKSGLELMDDKRSILIDRIKSLIVEMIHYSDEMPKVKNSEYLTNLFSEVTGVTIEQYIINHKIEKIKEFLLYDELSITEISYRLNYSSVAHLSNQFKKATGLTPSYFKLLKGKRVEAGNV